MLVASAVNLPESLVTSAGKFFLKVAKCPPSPYPLHKDCVESAPIPRENPYSFPLEDWQCEFMDILTKGLSGRDAIEQGNISEDKCNSATNRSSAMYFEPTNKVTNLAG